MAPPRAPRRRGLDRLLAADLGAVRATVAGVAAVAVIGGVLGPLEAQGARAAQALSLVVPVVAAAVLGGRRAAYAVAVAAAVAFALVVPPAGSMRVRLTEDLVALAVLSLVAVLVGSLVARRIELMRAVDTQRTTLLRGVSHDLRTPLAAIRAAASDLAGDDELPAEVSRRFARLIGEEAERLDRLVANLLSMGRIGAGAFTPERHPVDLAELVGGVAGRLRRSLPAVRIDTDVPADLPPVTGDHTQLDQLLTNLVENAARHSPAGSPVEVRARHDGRAVLLSVSDGGPGVDPAEVGRLFEPFRSGPVPGASGIGLAICRAVAEGHGGTISVGANPSGGAVFTVVLPAG